MGCGCRGGGKKGGRSGLVKRRSLKKNRNTQRKLVKHKETKIL